MNNFKSSRPTDKILTSVLLGYDMDQEFSGHHLFPDVEVPDMSGKIIAFGKEAYQVINTKRAPGETVRGIGISYSNDTYVLENRLLEAIVPEEDMEDSRKANIPVLSIASNTVYKAMRLEGEYDKASLALDPANYAATNKASLSGTSLWNDPTADLIQQVGDAKEAIRAKTGKYPNVFHLDPLGFAGLQNNLAILAKLKYGNQAFVDEAFLQMYFGVEKVVVGKTVHLADEDGDFLNLWKDSSVLAYVPPKAQQNKRSQSYGYIYTGKGFPIVEKEYFEKSDRSYHVPVLMRDKAILTDNGAGFLFQNTTG